MTNNIQNLRVDDVDYDVEGNHTCRRCAATGQFITYVENGKPKGPGGICFRCSGKGYHNRTDRKRNDYYDRRGYYQDRSGEHHSVMADHNYDTRGSLDGDV